MKIETTSVWKNGDLSGVSSAGSKEIEFTGLPVLDNYEGVWGPPHLFIASVESCLFATFQSVLASSHTEIKSYKSRAVGELTSDDGKHKYISEIVIDAEIGLEDKSKSAKVEKLLQKAEEYCLVAKTINAPIKLNVTFV